MIWIREINQFSTIILRRSMESVNWHQSTKALVAHTSDSILQAARKSDCEIKGNR